MTEERIAALDLIRGVAVLGILTVNVAGFAGPTAATLTPNLPVPGSPADAAVFAAVLVLFEGKMRALFTILFGASLLLFTERAEAAGRNANALQLRRLGWLALFGYLHFLLLWWGDILFLYAVAGAIVLPLRHVRPRTMLAAALLLFTAWQAAGIAGDAPSVRAELAVRSGHVTPLQRQMQVASAAGYAAQAADELAEYRSGFIAQVRSKLATRPLYPLTLTLLTLGETVPWMLVGMALYKLGLFAGTWPRARLRAMAWLGIVGGGLPTLAFAGWGWSAAFPVATMRSAVGYGLGFPHLAMALGYLAALALAAPRLLETALGQRLAAAGRMAFSNYLGTSLVMCSLFYGWGLGLVGRVPHALQPAFVLLAWGLMLAWSPWWLARFRQGPLEWLWRSLTEARALPFKP